MTMPEVFTVPEAASYMRVHEQTVYDLLRNGDLRGTKVGRAWRIHRSELERFLLGGSSMSIWAITIPQAQLLAATGRLQPTDENTLSQHLDRHPADVSSMVQSLIMPVTGCPTGLIFASVTHLSGQVAEHVSQVRLTPLGARAYLGVLDATCPLCHTTCGAVLAENTQTACGRSGEPFYIDAKRYAVRLQVHC